MSQVARRFSAARPDAGSRRRCSDAPTHRHRRCRRGLTLPPLPRGRTGPTSRRISSTGIGDLKLESGGTIKDFAISYVTHGTLNAQKSNAILMVTAISGNHHRLDFLIGPGKALDTSEVLRRRHRRDRQRPHHVAVEQPGAAAHGSFRSSSSATW